MGPGGGVRDPNQQASSLHQNFEQLDAARSHHACAHMGSVGTAVGLPKDGPLNMGMFVFLYVDATVMHTILRNADNATIWH